MAKEPAPGKKTGAGRAAALKSELDRLDRELLKLINQRARQALELSKHTSDPEAPIAFEDTDQHLAWLAEHSRGPLAPASVRNIFREVISGSLALQRPTRVAFLGPAYSYSHVATVHRFGSSAEQVPVGSIGAVFEEVNRGHADFGVVPVENSTDGRVPDPLEM